MDKVKDIAKHGYHPTGKDGGKESWRGDYKGINQVASWVGKGKNPNDIRAAKEHTSRPLTSLKDPDSFGPPPKNINYHGGATSSPTSTIPPARRDQSTAIPSNNIQKPQGQQQVKEPATQKPAPPPLPYRANRTGINTSDLPTTPVRRMGDGPTNPSSSSSPASITKPPKPNLPPRLPPRQNSNPLPNTPVDPPPSYASATQEQKEWGEQRQPPIPPARHNVFANQEGALNRLGSAGVKVPALGIRTPSSAQQTSENPWANEHGGAASQGSNPGSPSLSGLSSHFSNLSTATSSSSATPAPTPSKGTTWAEKQAALKTASSFHNDPSSVSLSDVKATASTANNFRERHGDQVAQGWKVGNQLNKKYGIADRVGSVNGSPATEQTPSSPSDRAPPNPWASVTSANTGINRKPPPPPVPLGSKPR